MTDAESNERMKMKSLRIINIGTFRNVIYLKSWNEMKTLQTHTYTNNEWNELKKMAIQTEAKKKCLKLLQSLSLSQVNVALQTCKSLMKLQSFVGEKLIRYLKAD